MATQLAVPEANGKDVQLIRAPQDAVTIRETVQHIDSVRAFIKEALIGPKFENGRKVSDGTDYDIIPGTDKKTMLQPGAEKVNIYLGTRPVYDIVKSDLGDGHVEFDVTCILISQKTGLEVSQGMGSCSTRESKYGFRWNESKIKPSDAEVAQHKAAGTGKWQSYRGSYVWKLRTDNPNIWDERHKVKLIACKRAYIKATRTMAALSELFTQDVDDFPEVEDVEPTKVESAPVGQTPQSAPSPSVEPPAEQVQSDPEPKAVTAERAAEILNGEKPKETKKTKKADPAAPVTGSPIALTANKDAFVPLPNGAKRLERLQHLDQWAQPSPARDKKRENQLVHYLFFAIKGTKVPLERNDGYLDMERFNAEMKKIASEDRDDRLARMEQAASEVSRDEFVAFAKSKVVMTFGAGAQQAQ